MYIYIDSVNVYLYIDNVNVYLSIDNVNVYLSIDNVNNTKMDFSSFKTLGNFIHNKSYLL